MEASTIRVLPKIRIDRLLSSQGLCSRKEAREIIKQGRVRVEGTRVRGSSQTVEGKPGLHFRVDQTNYKYYPRLYVMLNKPKSYDFEQVMSVGKSFTGHKEREFLATDTNIYTQKATENFADLRLATDLNKSDIAGEKKMPASRSPKSPLERVKKAGILTFCDLNEASFVGKSPKRSRSSSGSGSRVQTVKKGDPTHMRRSTSRSTSPVRRSLMEWSTERAQGFHSKNRIEDVED